MSLLMLVVYVLGALLTGAWILRWYEPRHGVQRWLCWSIVAFLIACWPVWWLLVAGAALARRTP
jgi:hypothetical protein